MYCHKKWSKGFEFLAIDNPIPFGKARLLENMHKICGAKVRKTIFYSSILRNLVILSATIHTRRILIITLASLKAQCDLSLHVLPKLCFWILYPVHSN